MSAPYIRGTACPSIVRIRPLCFVRREAFLDPRSLIFDISAPGGIQELKIALNESWWGEVFFHANPGKTNPERSTSPLLLNQLEIKSQLYFSTVSNWKYRKNQPRAWSIMFNHKVQSCSNEWKWLVRCKAAHMIETVSFVILQWRFKFACYWYY